MIKQNTVQLHNAPLRFVCCSNSNLPFVCVHGSCFNVHVCMSVPALGRGIITKDSIWDRLVFKRIQDGLGGNVRFVITGSAPLADNVLDFARCALGCKVRPSVRPLEALLLSACSLARARSFVLARCVLARCVLARCVLARSGSVCRQHVIV